MLGNAHRSIRMKTFSQQNLGGMTKYSWVSVCHAAAVCGTVNTGFTKCCCVKSLSALKMWSWSLEQGHFNPFYPFSGEESHMIDQIFNKETMS